MKIPIVFLHQGGGVVFNDTPFNYLNFAIVQARLFNPDAAIWVIGDKACLESLLPFHSRTDDLESYDAIIGSVRAVYRHFSSNNPEMEMLCIARWFVLREWMRRHGVNRCLHLDSDVLFYDHADGFDARFRDCGMILVNGHSGGSSVVNDVALDAICARVMRDYNSTDELQTMQAFYDEKCASGRPGGISDMHFLARVAHDDPACFRNVGTGSTDPVIDNSINYPRGFEMSGGVKRIEFIDGLPHGFLEAGGVPRRFALLHFQGDTKALMQNYLCCPGAQAVLGKPLLQLLKRHWNALRESFIQHRTLSNRSLKQSERLSAVRNRAQQLRVAQRKIGQSAWVKAGGTLRLSSAMKTLAESERLTEEINQLARP